MKYFCFSFIILSVLISGCATDYNLEAIKEARVYALEKYPDLSEESIHWIKFTTPKIRQEMIFPKQGRGSSNDFAQTCIVWDIPEYEGKSLVVVGYGERKLNDWYPVRAIFKRYRLIETSSKESNKK
jgi:hypothetical protein